MSVVQLFAMPQSTVEGGEAYLLELLEVLGRLANDLGYVEASHFIVVATEAITEQREREGRQ